jgi:hypothetical protein
VRRFFLATLTACTVLALAIFAFVRMPLLAPIGADAAGRALGRVRASLTGASPPTLGAEADAAQRGLPLVVTLYDHGQAVARGVGQGDTFGAALGDASEQLRAQKIDPARLARGRLKLDRVVGRGFLAARVLPLLALGAVPARDGIGVDDADAHLLMTNDDLVRERLWSGYRPLPQLEFAIGIDARRLFRAMALKLERSLNWRPRHLYRFRAEEYLETAPATATPIVAGHAPGPPVTRETLAAGARAGGDYLLAHLDAAGRFDYEYYLVEDSRVQADYSFPRHAGAASFLAQLYALDHDERVRSGAERALDVLVKLHPPGCDGVHVCVGEAEDPIVDLGGSALALVAVSEYARTTGDARYAGFAHGLVEFLFFMQKANGDFCHIFAPKAGGVGVRDEKTQLLYYSGEAAYALARWLALGNHEPGLAARATSALDGALHYLTHDAYDTFVGQFYVGEDHWTCMALDAGWDFLPPAHRDAYARFCDEFSRFLRRSQFRSGDSLVDAQPQLEGAYGITALLSPHGTPVGSRSETTISMWRLGKKRKLPDGDPRVAEPREQVLDGMRFLLARQLRAGTAYLAADENAAAGGIPESDVEAFVRIDFVQHGGSAMLRALELL